MVDFNNEGRKISLSIKALQALVEEPVQGDENQEAMIAENDGDVEA